MARAALQWSLEQAGAAAAVSRRTVLRFENDHRDIKPDLIAALRRAYEATGVPLPRRRPRRRRRRPAAAPRAAPG
jgi:transcriptional regulator with XRE-family HTH domain